MREGTLLIRADADAVMGTGHAMRCLALAQAWQDDGGLVIFAMVRPPSSVRERLVKESMEIAEIDATAGTLEDAARTADIASKREAAWVVVDGYHFGPDYQQRLKSDGLKILFVDDYGHAEPYTADIVLNQNFYAEESLYRKRETYTRLLLGPKYCLLRREFNQWREWKRQIPEVGRRVLVTMGGSDPRNFTEHAIEALDLIDANTIEAAVIVGGSNMRFESLQRTAAKAQNKIKFHRDISNMAELMAWADVVVSAAGTTCWEICLLGVPAILIDLAENQTPVAQALDREGCAIHLGAAKKISSQKLAAQLEHLLKCQRDRQTMSSRCRTLVDGRGSERVVVALGSGSLRLRPARENDMRLLWLWANDTAVRAAAFSSAPIRWEDHQAWLTGKLKDPDCHILIAEDEQGRAIGQFRTDWRSNLDADIDLSLSKEFRGVGYGCVLIDLGAAHALAERRAARLHAFVKPDNLASRRSFELAGFGILGEENVDGHLAVHYVRMGNVDRK